MFSSELALRGSAFSFGLGLPVRIVSECDREAQERDQHQPRIATYRLCSCRHLVNGSEARLLGAGASAALIRVKLELVLVVGAARREQLLGAAKGLVDILLEITLKEGEGPDKPGEVLL